MKNVMLIGALLVSSALCAQNWETQYFIDEFGDPTDNSYIVSLVDDGKFTNTAGSGELTAVMSIFTLTDGSGIQSFKIKLYEYSRGGQERLVYSNTRGKITFKTFDGKKYIIPALALKDGGIVVYSDMTLYNSKSKDDKYIREAYEAKDYTVITNAQQFFDMLKNPEEEFTFSISERDFDKDKTYNSKYRFKFSGIDTE